jgi:hypothetical protein
MLRFDLDYRPLERRTATRFVAALLDLDMAREAVNWLAALDDADPVKLALRLQARLIEPEAAIRRARAWAAKAPGAGWWGVIARAAELEGNRPLRIQALEQWLQLAAGEDPRQAGHARDLWRTYLELAREAAARNHLLENDDAAWSAFAASRINTEPVLARAAFAYLARQAVAPGARSNAQLQLELSLQIARLDAVAVRLFNDGSISPASLDPRLRYSLGTVAEGRGFHAAAVRMWQGLAPPAGASAIDWQLRLAAAMLRAGYRDDARARLEWVLRNARDAAQLDAARRKLKKL